MTTTSSNPQPSLVSTTPRPAAWKFGAALVGLVAAAGAGALVMRSVDQAPPTPVAAVAPVLVTAPITAAPGAHRVEHPDRGSAAGNVAAGERATAVEPARVAVCAACGVVQSVHAVQQKGAGTGLGAVAGGLLGGVVGHQMGGGNGRTAMTVLGAVGGGMAGNEVEKRARSETTFEVKVRMEDGNLRTFHTAHSLPVGAEVVAEGTTLSVRHDAPARQEPRTLRTSTSGNV
jgi:outer membrane lipoprotein SlyB